MLPADGSGQEGRSARRLAASAGGYGAGLVVAAATFAIAYDGGAYGLIDRGTLAIAIWWTVVLTVGLRLWRRAPAGGSLIVGAFLTGFALWTVASVAWASNAEGAFAEFNRVTLYLGVFTLAAFASSRASRDRWSDGLAVGIALIALVALASRLFPHLFPARELPRFLPSSQTRVSFPVGYWNGLAILVALALPLLLRAAIVSRRPIAGGLALAPIPAVAAVIYLTSSRGGVATALVGGAALFALAERRWRLTAATAVAAAGSAVAVAVLITRSELVNGPLDSSRAAGQGRTAALWIGVACVGTGLTYVLGRCIFAQAGRPNRALGRALLALAASLAIAGIVVADPAQRLREFKQPPSQLALSQQDFARAHLLSGNGSGRWQFWSAAVDEWKHRPLLGGGAGSYEAWWARHGSISYFVKDAHSLYLEVLGELGLIGLILLSGALVSGFVCLIRRLTRAEGDERATLAALGSAFVAFGVGAGVDWMWELTVVPAVAFACLGLIAGAGSERRGPNDAGQRRSPLGLLSRLGVAAAGVLVICAHGIPLLAAIKIHESQVAVRHANGSEALVTALAARRLEPWASSPYLQLALVEEQAGSLRVAREWIRKAIDRSPDDWRLWLVAARIETKSARIDEARLSLLRAAELNPRSPLFRGVSR